MKDRRRSPLLFVFLTCSCGRVSVLQGAVAGAAPWGRVQAHHCHQCHSGKAVRARSSSRRNRYDRLVTFKVRTPAGSCTTSRFTKPVPNAPERLRGKVTKMLPGQSTSLVCLHEEELQYLCTLGTCQCGHEGLFAVATKAPSDDPTRDDDHSATTTTTSPPATRPPRQATATSR